MCNSGLSIGKTGMKSRPQNLSRPVPHPPRVPCPAPCTLAGAFGVVRMAVHRRTGLKYAVKTVWKSQLRRRADVEDLRREVQVGQWG